MLEPGIPPPIAAELPELKPAPMDFTFVAL
jgi:hypothetical protein